MNKTTVILSLALVILGVAAALSTSHPRVHFLTAAETRQFIADDSDGFVRNLTPINLTARKVDSNVAYIELGIKNAREFSPIECEMLEKAVRHADAILAKKAEYLPNYGLTRDILDIPWNLAKIRGAIWENGMPHTRVSMNGDGVIFLSEYYLTRNLGDINRLTKTLIHEKVHLYQKRYSIQYQAFLLARGYTPIQLSIPYKRQNPDTDDIIYKSPDGKPMYCAFQQAEPTDLSNIEGNSHEEHPNEYFAYLFADTLF